jgi:hypothetical protein
VRKVTDDDGLWARREVGKIGESVMDVEHNARGGRGPLRAAVWGAAVGDALGVPYEFRGRGA